MKSPAVLFDQPTLRATVARLGLQISEHYPDGVVLVAVLKGALLFFADLVREVTVPVAVDFLALSRYAPDSGRVKLLKDLDVDVTDRHVVVVEDLVDTGLTLAYLRRQILERGAASFNVCALLDRSVRRIVPLPLQFVGHEVGDEYVLGYGLHHQDRYRNLSAILAGDRAVLEVNPDAYLATAYGQSRV